MPFVGPLHPGRTYVGPVLEATVAGLRAEVLSPLGTSRWASAVKAVIYALGSTASARHILHADDEVAVRLISCCLDPTAAQLAGVVTAVLALTVAVHVVLPAVVALARMARLLLATSSVEQPLALVDATVRLVELSARVQHEGQTVLTAVPVVLLPIAQVRPYALRWPTTPARLIYRPRERSPSRAAGAVGLATAQVPSRLIAAAYVLPTSDLDGPAVAPLPAVRWLLPLPTPAVRRLIAALFASSPNGTALAGPTTAVSIVVADTVSVAAVPIDGPTLLTGIALPVTGLIAV